MADNGLVIAQDVAAVSLGGYPAPSKMWAIKFDRLRPGLAVQQMCCSGTRGQSLKTLSLQGADSKGGYSKHQSSRQTLCSAMDFSILSAFCRRDLSA